MSRIGANAFEHFRSAVLRSGSQFSINSSACCRVGRPSCEAGRYPLFESWRGLLLSPWVDFHIDFNPTLGKTYQDRAVFLASWRTLVSVVGTRPIFGRFPTKVNLLLARLYDDQLSRPIQ
jgi:hypothetical protein